MSAPPDKQVIYSARWYRKNRDEFLASLGDRYRDDPEFRKLKIAYGKDYEQRRAEGYFPNFRPLYREHNGQRVRVFRLSEVAPEIGRIANCVRIWEHTNQVPSPTFERQLYTQRQVELLRLLADAYPAKDFVRLRREISDFIWRHWSD